MDQPYFNLNEWRMALSDVSSVDVAEAIFSDSPISVAVIEHYRRLAKSYAALGPSVKTDRFVLGKGYGQARHHTKTSGLPYRPAKDAWPCNAQGEPMVFLAQFCFGDSLDLFESKLPGDVLLMFVERIPRGQDLGLPSLALYSKESIIFEWQSLGIAQLCEVGDVPPSPVVLPTCYGVKHRSVDYVDEERVKNVLLDVIPPELIGPPRAVRDWTLRGIIRHPQMKIGGIRFWRGLPERAVTGKLVHPGFSWV